MEAGHCSLELLDQAGLELRDPPALDYFDTVSLTHQACEAQDRPVSSAALILQTPAVPDDMHVGSEDLNSVPLAFSARALPTHASP